MRNDYKYIPPNVLVAGLKRKVEFSQANIVYTSFLFGK